jgi:type IV fimbrial biogenesis protein FimT
MRVKTRIYTRGFSTLDSPPSKQRTSNAHRHPHAKESPPKKVTRITLVTPCNSAVSSSRDRRQLRQDGRTGQWFLSYQAWATLILTKLAAHPLTGMRREISLKMRNQSGSNVMKANRINISARPPSGFTLIEIIVVITILAILLAIAVPSFRDLSLGSASVAQTNRLLTNLNTARIEAVKRSSNVRVRALAGNWNNGWEVLDDRDGTVIQQGVPAKTGFSITASTAPGGVVVMDVVFTPSGTLSPIDNGVMFTFKRPDDVANRAARKCLLVSPSGRAESQKGTSTQCSGAL